MDSEFPRDPSKEGEGKEEEEEEHQSRREDAQENKNWNESPASGQRSPKKDVHGQILSLQSWVLKPHHNLAGGEEEEAGGPSRVPEVIVDEANVIFDGPPEICAPHLISSPSAADANVDHRDSFTETFSRAFANMFERQLLHRRRARQVGCGVALGLVVCVACALGVLYAGDEEKLRKNEKELSKMDAMGSLAGVKRNRTETRYACDVRSAPKCAETGRCVDTLVNGNQSFLCVCDLGFHGGKCERGFCTPNPCLSRFQETCEMSSIGIPRCRRPNSCENSDPRDVAIPSDVVEGGSGSSNGAATDAATTENGFPASFRCGNGSTCLPYAVEFGGIRSEFVCICREGYYGIHCNKKLKASYVIEEANNDNRYKDGNNVDGGSKQNTMDHLGKRDEDNSTAAAAADDDDDDGGLGRGKKGQSNWEEGGEMESEKTIITRVPMPLPCVSVHCSNGGTCLNLDTVNWKCACPREFKGRLCREKLRPCEVKRCANGGICKGDGKVAKCLCPNSFHGEVCQYRNGCVSSPCHPSSTCVPYGEGIYTCVCDEKGEWIGDDCKTRDPCFSSPCQNGGKCILALVSGSTPNTYNCICDTQKFVGNHCELSSPCSTAPCQNGGTCHPEEKNTGEWVDRCECNWQEYVGLRCERVSACVKYPCKNDSRCRPKMDGETRDCKCKKDFTGDDCEEFLGRK